jgi:hypothetical protein
MIVSVNDGFLYTSKNSLLSFLVIVTSKKLILLFTSSSKLKFRLGTVLLNASRTLCMFVLVSLYTTRMSSPYRK